MQESTLMHDASVLKPMIKRHVPQEGAGAIGGVVVDSRRVVSVTCMPEVDTPL